MVTQLGNKTILKTGNPFFSAAWWKEFVKQTNDFTSHQVVRNGISESELIEFRALVNEILQKISTDKSKLNDTRIWTEGDQVKQPFDFFEKHPIDQDVELWGQKTFKDKKYGMFINYANNHSEKLTKKLNEYIQPYIKNFGIPMKGISTTIILGNYGWTPLGVHNDEKGEYILHFHLGPGEKDMYIWDREKANSLGYKEKVRVENLDEYLEHYDHKCSFNTGDLFSMPGKCVHIGNTKEFSIGIVVEFNGLTTQEFTEMLWLGLRRQLFNRTFRGKEAVILPPYKPEDHDVFIENLMRKVKHYNIDPKASLGTALEKIYTDHKYSLLSNAGFSTHALHDDQAVPSVDIKSTDYVTAGMLADVMYYKEESKLHLFIRGVKISVNYDENIPRLIDQINGGYPVKIADLEADYWPDKEALHQFIRMLYKYKGVDLSPSI